MTLNIGAASLERADSIDSWIRDRDDDVLVLTETSRGDGTRLVSSRMTERGYSVRHETVGRDRGVLLATRVPILRSLDELGASSMPWRSVGVLLDTPEPIAVVGVYAPSRNRQGDRAQRKLEFLESLSVIVADIARSTGGRVLLMGDFNAIPRDHEPAHPGFIACEYVWHDRLADLGLVNAHEVLCQPQPHSWIGHTGNRYLYDYAHLGGSLQDELVSCEYLHSPRDRGLSDHAAVAVTLSSR